MTGRFILRALHDPRGASAVEFALVLPLFLLFFFGLIDVGRYMWEVNQGEKAAQMGARWAVVTNSLSPGLRDATYVGVNVNGTVLTQGDLIPQAALGLMTCTSSGCACTTNPCPTPGTMNNADFNRLWARINSIKKDAGPGNIVVEYRGSGLGYAGDPNGMEISPLVTVRLQNLNFRPLMTAMFARSMVLPEFSYTLTMEDANGTSSN